MGNEVAAQAGTKGLTFQVPAHIAARLKTMRSNIPDKATTNSLTFAGKVWKMTVNGETKVLQRRNEDGDMENVQTLRVVVLDWNLRQERKYYPGGFVEGQAKAPECWSQDGQRPDASVEEPKARACETCPMAAKGSKIGPNGEELYACDRYRVLAVVPASDLDFPALRLQFKPTSDFDKKDEEALAQGWYAWQQYRDHLKANGVPNTCAVITRIRFAGTNYPKLQFTMGGFVTDDAELTKLDERSQSDEVKKLLAGFTPTPAAPKGKPLPKDDDAAETTVDPKPKGPTPEQLAAEAAAKAEAEKKAKAEARAKAKAEAEAAKKAAEEAAARAKAAEEDDAAWDEPVKHGEVIPPKAAAKADTPPPRRNAKLAEAPPTAPAEVPGAIASLMSAWD